MDRYSYDPNSRIARRIKERERKKRRNRRIMGATALLLVLAVVAFGVFKYVGLGSGILKEFNPAAGLERLVAAITDNNEDKLVSNDLDIESEDAVVPELEEPVNEPDPVVQTDDDIPDVPTTAEGIYPPASENNNLLDIFRNAAGETEKICALTF
ncbi:MAG: hypothetical protein IJ366_01495, partial [Clostridia bacterium]|nr:hypothetical protein [Clostridia bacterium]